MLWRGASCPVGLSVFPLSCAVDDSVQFWADDRVPEDAMKNFALKVQRFLTTEDGPTAVEYAVMLALIVIVCLTAIQAIGTNASATFQNVADQL
jgi:pilus assembly protein Flp/PilA